MSALTRMLVALVAGLVTACAEPPRVPFDAAPWREDFADLKRQLEDSYANLAWFASPSSGVDLPALDRRTRRAIDAAQSDEDARLAIRQFVAAFHDGHFSELPFQERAPEPLRREPPPMALERLDAHGACAARGYADRSTVAFSLPFETLPGFRLLGDGSTSAFRSGLYQSDDRRVGLVRIKNFSQLQYPTVCVRAWNQLSPVERGDREAFDDKVTELWLEELATTLRSLATAGATSLLVDVGTNSGGNDSGDWATRLFSDRVVSSARLRMTSGPLFERYLSETGEELEKVASNAASQDERRALSAAAAALAARRSRAAERGCALDWVWREQRAWDPDGCSRLADAGWASGPFYATDPKLPVGPRVANALFWPARVAALRGTWTRPVVVLINAATYSSAEMFAATMRDNDIARLIGVRTGGDGCGFMVRAAPTVLPHSRMRFRMSNCVRLRGDGSNEVRGVAPDVELNPVEGESARVRAMRALEIALGGAA